MNVLSIVLAAWSVLLAADPAPKSGLAGTVDKPARQVKPEREAPAATVQDPGFRLRAAQLMLVTLQGFQAPNNEDREILAHYTPGGLVIPLTAKPGQAADYISALRSAQKGVPFLIAASVYNLTEGQRGAPGVFPQLPSPDRARRGPPCPPSGCAPRRNSRGSEPAARCE